MSGGGLIGAAPITLALETRQKRAIENSLNFSLPHAGLQLQVDGFKKQYPLARHRDVGPCNTYNCHGLTLASRRCAVTEPDIIQILKDDGFVEVTYSDAECGDVIVYIEQGAVTHSGVVVGRKQVLEGVMSEPIILSKWGYCHEVVHKVHECMYFENATCNYYRLKG